MPVFISILIIGIMVAVAMATALSDDYQRDRRPIGPRQYTIKDNEIIYTGALCCIDSNGELLAGTDTNGLEFAGVYYGDRIDNTDDGLTCIVDKVQEFKAAGSGFAAGDIGAKVYLADDNTVAKVTTNSVYVGRITQVISATEVWVDPTASPENVVYEAQEVADAASATSTNGAVAAVTLTEAITPQVDDGDIAALTFTAGGATGPEVEALRDKCEDLAEDLIALNTVVDTNHTELEALIAELEKVAADARAALASAAAAITALKTLTLLADPS